MRRFSVPVLFQVSEAHLISHVHCLVIPALLPLLPSALGVSFIELGAAVSLFNVVSALFQAPLGFAVDRFGARRMLMAGLLLGSFGFMLFALQPTYAWLLVMAAVTGAANGVYHPADYAILSRAMPETVMGRSFSVHSFAGFLGSAVTPALLTAIAAFGGIAWAVAFAGFSGFASFLFLAVSRPGIERAPAPGESGKSTKGKPSGVLSKGVFSGTVLLLTLLFALLSLSTSSLERFSVSALIQGYGMDLLSANAVLTAYLTCSAAGVLSGGFLADRTKRHGFVAATAFAAAAVLTILTALFTMPVVAMAVVLGLIGFLTGIIVPSREMLVRAAAPQGSEGKVFGIVTTGFNLGGTIGPILFGWLLDSDLPRWIFWSSAAFMIMTVALTWSQERSMARKRTPEA